MQNPDQINIGVANQIYTNIHGFRGGQVEYWHEVEGDMFSTIANWFGGWMRSNGMADVSTETRANVVGWLQHFEAAGMLANGAANFPAPAPALGSDLINGVVNCYTIGTLKKLLGAIYDIGTNTQGSNRGYLIRFNDGSLIYLCHTTHYAYPILNAAGGFYNLNNYNVHYNALMANAIDTPVDDVIRFINRKLTPPAPVAVNGNIDLGLQAVFVANYICESDRNWMQLLISLIFLGAPITYRDANDAPVTERLTSFNARAQNLFPMGGGGWTNRASWGGGVNPAPAAGANINVDGNEIKRWMLSILIMITEQVYIDDENLGEDIWKAWIANSLNGGPAVSRDILNRLTQILNKAVTTIGNVR